MKPHEKDPFEGYVPVKTLPICEPDELPPPESDKPAKHRRAKKRKGRVLPFCRSLFTFAALALLFAAVALVSFGFFHGQSTTDDLLIELGKELRNQTNAMIPTPAAPQRILTNEQQNARAQLSKEAPVGKGTNNVARYYKTAAEMGRDNAPGETPQAKAPARTNIRTFYNGGRRGRKIGEGVHE